MFIYEYFTRDRSPHAQGSLIASFEDWVLSWESENIKYWLAILSCILSFCSVIFVAAWADGTAISQGYLGGLDYQKNIFNYHPVLMVTGTIFFATTSMLSYKVVPYSPATKRFLHITLHISAIICFSTGIHYARLSKTPKYNEEGVYKASLVTLHSWIGLLAVAVYLFNFAGGLLVFVLKIGSEAFSTVYMMNHRTFGIISLVLSACAAVSGTQLRSTCSREVGYEDTNPAVNYYDLSAGCRVSSGMGICVIISTMLAMYTIIPSAGTGSSDNERQIQYAPEHVAEAAMINIGEKSKPGGNQMPPHHFAHSDTNLLAR